MYNKPFGKFAFGNSSDFSGLFFSLGLKLLFKDAEINRNYWIEDVYFKRRHKKR